MSRLSRLALNEEGFVFDPATGDSFLANHCGLLIIRALGEGRHRPGRIGFPQRGEVRAEVMKRRFGHEIRPP